MAKLIFLGGMATVGCSGVLLDTGKERVVLDYGTKVGVVPPKFPLPVEGNVNAVLLSHAHLDHSGGVPLLAVKGCPVYALDCTKQLTELLLLDCVKINREEGVQLPFDKKDVRKTVDAFVPVEYRKEFNVNSVGVIYFDAGHIPGSATIYLSFNGKTLLYTGDLKTTDTRLLKKADLHLPQVDYLITESTYADREHPERRSQEKELIRIINETLSLGGVCIVAGFAVGRLQEIMLILEKHGITYPLYLDGMAKKATTIINQYNRLLKEPTALDRALSKVTYVSNDRMRRKIIKQPCVILTTSGMLSGGPVVWYLKRLHSDRNSSLVLTGFQVEGTPGRLLLETGRFITEEINIMVRMFVKRLDFSAHVGRKGLAKFIDKLNPQRIFCVHGDHTEEFASELRGKGYDAVAPVGSDREFEI